MGYSPLKTASIKFQTTELPFAYCNRSLQKDRQQWINNLIRYYHNNNDDGIENRRYLKLPKSWKERNLSDKNIVFLAVDGNFVV